MIMPTSNQMGNWYHVRYPSQLQDEITIETNLTKLYKR